MSADERRPPLIKRAIPLLHVSDAGRAERFYCGLLGFDLEFAHRSDDAVPDPCYMGVSRDGVWLHLSSFSGDGVAGGVVNFLVDSVDALHAEFVKKRVPIAVGPVDQSWGTREMYVKDADGNSIRFQQL
ncbi:MAG TPA: VOC family protein [Candidatus Acidoferrales bacterium]|nr:VOC family protein [Candidatus Acidoferrales bacterium]